ncbi:MAG: methyltransferase domain-containing protein [Dehalococcoidia bacterium]|nr:methyltransferase domain-containing protein [Dehalococcoidia bacterium]
MDKEEYLRMYHQEMTHWWYTGMRKVTEAFLGPPGSDRTHRILDAGCGTGAGLVFLSRYGTAYGVDMAQEAIDFCLMRGMSRVARASVASLPFPSLSFDLLTSFDVIYHRSVEDDVSTLREFHRVLKDGGRILLRAPAFEFLRGGHDLIVHTRHRYQSGELETKLKTAGFAVNRISYANCLLSPLAIAKRLTEPNGRRESDVQPTHRLINGALTGILAAEARWLRRWSFPFGLSLFALAWKPPTRSGP